MIGRYVKLNEENWDNVKNWGYAANKFKIYSYEEASKWSSMYIHSFSKESGYILLKRDGVGKECFNVYNNGILSNWVIPCNHFNKKTNRVSLP